MADRMRPWQKRRMVACCFARREPVPGQVSQPHPRRVRSTGGALHRPHGVIGGTVCSQRIRKGIMAASRVSHAVCISAALLLLLLFLLLYL